MQSLDLLVYEKFVEHPLFHKTHVEKGKENRAVLSLFLTHSGHHLTSGGKLRLGMVQSQKGHQKWLTWGFRK